MLPDWVSNPGPLTYESGALPIALLGLAVQVEGPNSEEYKQATEDFRKECYSQICFVDLISFC